MTAFASTGANDPDLALGEEDDVLRDKTGKDNADWIGKIGTVAEGSLEEEIWRELGALPSSRRLNLRS